MAEISNELLYEVLKSVQARVAQVDGKADENKGDMLALKYQITAIHQDLLGIHSELSSMHSTLIRHEHRLDRIEHRLELNEAPSLT
jgi:predicted  nucleic acid-binding Zn-ribbon protein